jgi:glycosyltransferase involved in cell wall biosynthesis
MEFIESCCESIKKGLASFNLEFEVVVVDNGSTDNTGEIVKNILSVDYIKIDRVSISEARNIGAKKSSGKYLAFIDADVVICEEWANALAVLVEDESDSPIITGFQYFVRQESTWIEKYWFSGMKSSHINGGNLIVSRSAFDILGGFNVDLKTGEDVDLCDRAKHSKLIAFRPDCRFRSIHLGYPRTVRQFFKREAWHGEGDYSSFAYFLKSKIALMAFAYASIEILIICLLLAGSYALAILFFFIFLSINFVVTMARFRGRPIKAIAVNSILNYIYFSARFFSFFKSVFR